MPNLKDLKFDKPYESRECSYCGAKHEVQTKIVFGLNALKELSKIACGFLPIGNILYITAEDLTDKSREIERALFKTHILNIQRLPSNFKPGLQDAAKILETAEDCKLVISYGSGKVSDLAKYAAFIKNLPHILIMSAPSSLKFLTDVSKFYNNGLPKIYAARFPDVLIADLSLMSDCPKNLIADGFGKVIGCLISLIDCKVSAVLEDNFLCENVLELISDSVKNVLNIQEKLASFNLNALEILTESVLKISLFKQLTGRNLFGAQNDIADILNLIEKEEKKLDGEVIFLTFLKVLNLYGMFINSNLTPLLFPPDYIKRAETLRNLNCNLPEILKEFNSKTGFERELYIHKLNEYKDELKKQINSAVNDCKSCNTNFRRIYSDKGYSIQNYQAFLDFKTAVYLSPAVNKDLTLLSFMSGLGYLEKVFDN